MGPFCAFHNFTYQLNTVFLFRIQYNAQNALQWDWGFTSFANGNCRNGICWGLLLQFAKFMKIHFLPHFEYFMCKQKFQSQFLKKDQTQPSNGVLPTWKLQFPNGSYRNGICWALWAILLILKLVKVVNLFCKSFHLPSTFPLS